MKTIEELIRHTGSSDASMERGQGEAPDKVISGYRTHAR